MDLWSVIPIRVHQYTILSTISNSTYTKIRIPREINIRSKGLVKINSSLVTQPMHASFSLHHSNLKLAYTTQAWNFKFKTCAMQKHMKCTSKCINQVYVLAPLTCVLKILIDPLTFSYLSPYVKVLPLCHLTLSLCNFSPFVINDHKCSILDRLRLSMSKIFNSVWSKDKLLHTSLQGLSWPYWVKHLYLIF